MQISPEEKSVSKLISITSSRTANRVSIWSKYFSLTKPKVVLLLLITGLTGFLLTNDQGLPAIILFCYTGYASAGGAMAINSYIDRDVDRLMERTLKRASVGNNAIKPRNILVFGSILVGSAILLAFVIFNLNTAFFVCWGVLFYIIGYSLYLKRKTVLNTVLGGFSSAAPVWVGFAAGLGHVPVEGWLLGLLVFIWNPAHTWTLAAKYLQDYKEARIPMFPVVYGLKHTSEVNFILGIILIMYSSVLALWLSTEYLLVVLILLVPHLLLIIMNIKFLRNPTEKIAYKTFKVLNIWLAIVFITIVLLSV
ncbi:MAG: heme o synthase [Candidatus Odinarchaeota archaeon]